MKVSELQPRQGKVDIIVELVEKGEVREFSKFGKSGRVCNATVKDDSGTIKLTLWNDDIDKVNVGDKVELKNGFVNEYQGEMQLTAGRFGSLEVVGSKKETTEESKKQDEKEESGTKESDEDGEEEKPAKKTTEEEKPATEKLPEDISVEEELVE